MQSPTVAIGMTSDDVLNLMGPPASKEVGWYGDVNGEKWIYTHCDVVIAKNDHTVREIRWHGQSQSPKAKPPKSATTKKAHAKQAPRHGSSVDDDMRMLVRAGVLLNSNDAFDEFQVSPSKWTLMPFDAKRGVVITVSMFAKEKTGKSYVKLRDYMTGRLLASYDAWSGIKIVGTDD